MNASTSNQSDTPTGASTDSDDDFITKNNASSGIVSRLPIILGIAFLLFGGIFLLSRSDAQARDTIRKHHLQDIEDALFLARDTKGTFPPYESETWCGALDSPEADHVKQQIEDALRVQNEKYANPAKPFPVDPDEEAATNLKGYFYWKHSPASMELYANLEEDPHELQNVSDCETYQDKWLNTYNYSLPSVWREHQ